MEVRMAKAKLEAAGYNCQVEQPRPRRGQLFRQFLVAFDKRDQAKFTSLEVMNGGISDADVEALVRGIPR